MSPTLGIIIMMNNYFHDVATALLLASGVVMWVVIRNYQEGASPDTDRYFLRLYRGVTTLAKFSLAWIILRIFIFGLGPSVSLVELMGLRLERFGHQVVPLITAGREFLDPLLNMTEQDLLFVICFFDVNPALQLVLDYAQEKNCPAIMLTDTLGSIIGEKANVVLSAKRGPVSGFHSLVVPMTIINSLLLAMGGEESGVMENLDRLDQLRERIKNYSGSST